jgi:DNA repair protein RadC
MENLPLYTIKKNPSSIIPVKVKSSRDVYELAKQFYGEDIDVYESFFLVAFNSAMEAVGWAKISQGSINCTTVDIRLVAKYALDALAIKCVLVHNHPTGNLNPSDADKELTEKIKNGLALLDIKVSDHLIVTSNGYYSFLDSGLL